MEKTKTAKEIDQEYRDAIQVLQGVLSDCGNEYFKFVPQFNEPNKIIVETNLGVFGFDDVKECKAWTSGLHFAVWNKLKFKKDRRNN